MIDNPCEALIRILYDAWPHKAISPALGEATGLPIGEVLTFEVAQKAGADFTGLKRFADAVLAAGYVPPGPGDRRKLLGDLKAVRAHHAYTRDRLGQPGCEVRKVAAEYVETLDLAIVALTPPLREADGG